MADADQRKQKQRLHLQGTLIVFLGVLWLTPDSLLIKLVESDGGWETLFWRHVFYFATMTAGLLAHAAWSTPQAAGESTSCCCQLPRAARIWMGQIKATGRFGAVWVAVQVPGNLGFIIGQSHTTAANVLIVVSTTPLWSALFSRVFLREPVPLRTVIAIAGAMAAIVALFWGELAVSSDELTGLLLALMCAVSLAINFTLLRRAAVVVPDALFPALFPLQSLVCGGIALAFGAQPGSVLPGDMKWLALQGCCVVPLSFIALTVGPKYISAAEVSLFLLLETVLGPVWVWLVLGEEPSPTALWAGGALILVLGMHEYAGMNTRALVEMAEVKAEEAAEAAKLAEQPHPASAAP